MPPIKTLKDSVRISGNCVRLTNRVSHRRIGDSDGSAQSARPELGSAGVRFEAFESRQCD